LTTSKLNSLKKNVAPYEKTDTKSSIKQIINTLGPLVLFWYAAFLSLSISYWLAFPFILLSSGFLVRTFIICHDCTHQSFFKSRLANDIIGTITGILTLIPYQQWKNSHSIHHATSSNLDKRGTGDMWLLTVDEYTKSSWTRRFAYRFYRNPVTMLVLGPIGVFLIQYRMNAKGARRKEKINTYITNISLVVLYGLLIWAIGWQAFLLIQGPMFMISGMLGIWLFYVQHQFEDSYFENNDEWSYLKAAVEGSSYYKLPKVLQWITGNIGFHHVHHLSPKIPNYNLEKAHNAVPPLQMATTITLKTSFKSLNHRLWDENSKTFVGFNQIKHLIKNQESVADQMKIPNPRLEGE